MEELEFMDKSFDDIDTNEFKTFALSVIKNIKRSLLQLASLPKKSLEFKLLAWEINRNLNDIKVLIDNMIGEEIPPPIEQFERKTTIKDNNSLEELLKIVDITEEKLQEASLIEAIAFFLAFYEIIQNDFCNDCIVDAE